MTTCTCPAGSYDYPNAVHEPYCPLARRQVLIRRVYRTGVQTVECMPCDACGGLGSCSVCADAGLRFFLTIKNRTYASEVEVPRETARRYYRAMSA